MKTFKNIIAIVAIAALYSCASQLDNAQTEADTCTLSWILFCQAHHYDVTDESQEVVNEYLDCWAGSADEEAALQEYANIK